MILETIALVTLAASSLSDSERRRAGAMAAMGEWRRLLVKLGPTAYLELIASLPEGELRHAAYGVLESIYLEIAQNLKVARSLIEVDDDANVFINPAYAPNGKPGAYVNAWISAVARAQFVDSIRVAPDASAIGGSGGGCGGFVLSEIWVPQERLVGWLAR